METGEIYAEAGDELDAAAIQALADQGFETIDVLDIDHVTVGAYMRNSLRVDKNASRDEALFDIYRVMRPGEPPRSTPPRPCSTACSSIPNATTCPRSAG